MFQIKHSVIVQLETLNCMKMIKSNFVYTLMLQNERLMKRTNCFSKYNRNIKMNYIAQMFHDSNETILTIHRMNKLIQVFQ